MTTTNFKEQYTEEEKGEMKMAEQIETIEEIEQVEEQEKGEGIMTIEQAEQSKPMFTISKDMLVVETDKDFSNPLSYDKEAIQLFLDNNKYALERYFNDNENNYGISFYECGYNGTAQDDFIKGWKENGVKVV